MRSKLEVNISESGFTFFELIIVLIHLLFNNIDKETFKLNKLLLVI